MNKIISAICSVAVITALLCATTYSKHVDALQADERIEAITEGVIVNAPAEESIPLKPTRRESKAIYTTTAYCSCAKCCGKSDGITASGEKATEGVTIAADTSVLPFGTQVEIDGHAYTVQDRGGAVKGNRIDIYFESHEKALQYGRQTKEVIILKGE